MGLDWLEIIADLSLELGRIPTPEEVLAERDSRRLFFEDAHEDWEMQGQELVNEAKAN